MVVYTPQLFLQNKP